MGRCEVGRHFTEEDVMALYEDGWRATDCEELMGQLGIGRSKAIVLCEILADIEVEYE